MFPSIRSRILRILDAELGPSPGARGARAVRPARSPIPDVDLCFHVGDEARRSRVIEVASAHPTVDRADAGGEFVTLRLDDRALASVLLDPVPGPRAPSGADARLAPVEPDDDPEWAGRVARVAAAWASLLDTVGVAATVVPAGPPPSDGPSDPAVFRTGSGAHPAAAPRRVAVAAAGDGGEPAEARRHILAVLQTPPWRKASPRAAPRPWSGADLPERLLRLGSMVRYAAGTGAVDAAEGAAEPAALRIVRGRERSLVLRILSVGDVVDAAARLGDPSRVVREAGVVLRALDEYYPRFRFMTDDDELQRGRAIFARAAERHVRWLLKSVGVEA